MFSLGGFVELLEDEELDPETRRRFLDQVRDQVERLRKLSVDLLDLSRLESGSLELRPEEVDLGELTRSVSGEFEPTLAQHDAHLELRLPTPIEAQCDPVRVAQIMRILIDNALTHTPRGNPHRRHRRRARTATSAWPCATTATASTRDAAAADLRAVLHRRRRPGLRAWAGHRLRAGRAHGGPAVGRTRRSGATTFTLEIPA